ncbi:MAG: PQQ-like beta-propeller repeat protein [Dehalococcoidales bacterium]|nr:PQQ-like beta-propeller repeat protein [Dehalococcoidales bacterium]
MRIRGNTRLLGRILFLVVTLVVGGVALTGCYGKPQPKGWSGVAITDDTLFVGSADGRLVGINRSDGSLWPDSLLGDSTSGVAIYGTPAVVGDLVYVGGYDGKIYAIDAISRLSRNRYPSEGEKNHKPIIGGIAVSGGKLYLGNSDGRLYALDTTTLNKEWEFKAGDRIWSTPALSGGTLYVGSFDKSLYALNTADGSKRWEFKAGGAILATPLVANNTVYVGCFDRHVYAVNADDGSLKWRSEIEADKWFWANLALYNNVIYAPCLDGKVYLLDAETGSEIAGAIELGSPISSSPVVVGDKIILASQEGKVYSLDTGNYRLTLLIDIGDEEQKIDSPLSTSEGVVYIHAQKSGEDTIYAVDVGTGVTQWKVSLKK